MCSMLVDAEFDSSPRLLALSELELMGVFEKHFRTVGAKVFQRSFLTPGSDA
jgi:hypothetical protein